MTFCAIKYHAMYETARASHVGPTYRASMRGEAE